MSKIVLIKALEVLDSRGNPTVKVKVETEFGGIGSAIVPSGASTGENEAVELRDGAISNLNSEIKNHWFGQKGVSVAVRNVNEIIAPKLIGQEVTSQRQIDHFMIKLDNTPNKKNLGANAILGVSLAVAKAAADERGVPLYRYLGGTNAHRLPVPMFNVLNGGVHAPTNTIDFQEFMIMPVGAKSIRQALQMANKVFHNLAKLLKEAGHTTSVGDEGGFAPSLKSHEEAFDFLVKAIQNAGFNPAIKGDKAIAIAIDPASSEFYNTEQKKYIFSKAAKAGLVSVDNSDLSKPKGSFTADEMIQYLENLVNKYPIISVEDGFSESDWEGFRKFNAQMGHRIQVMGDDIFVTNPIFLKRAIKEKSANSILIKVNQIGTLTETMDVIEMAQKANYTCVVSHRSGETEDTTIADLSVAFNTGQIKTGSMSRTDRISKYNRLLEIEDELGKSSVCGGEEIFYNLKK